MLFCWKEVGEWSLEVEARERERSVSKEFVVTLPGEARRKLCSYFCSAALPALFPPNRGAAHRHAAKQ